MTKRLRQFPKQTDLGAKFQENHVLIWRLIPNNSYLGDVLRDGREELKQLPARDQRRHGQHAQHLTTSVHIFL